MIVPSNCIGRITLKLGISFTSPIIEFLNKTKEVTETNICLCLVGKCVYANDKQLKFKISHHYQNCSDTLLDTEKAKQYFTGTIEKADNRFTMEFDKSTFPISIDPKFLRLSNISEEARQDANEKSLSK